LELLYCLSESVFGGEMSIIQVFSVVTIGLVLSFNVGCGKKAKKKLRISQPQVQVIHPNPETAQPADPTTDSSAGTSPTAKTSTKEGQIPAVSIGEDSSTEDATGEVTARMYLENQRSKKESKASTSTGGDSEADVVAETSTTSSTPATRPLLYPSQGKHTPTANLPSVTTEAPTSRAPKEVNPPQLAPGFVAVPSEQKVRDTVKKHLNNFFSSREGGLEFDGINLEFERYGDPLTKAEQDQLESEFAAALLRENRDVITTWFVNDTTNWLVAWLTEDLEIVHGSTDPHGSLAIKYYLEQYDYQLQNMLVFRHAEYQLHKVAENHNAIGTYSAPRSPRIKLNHFSISGSEFSNDKINMRPVTMESGHIALKNGYQVISGILKELFGSSLIVHLDRELIKQVSAESTVAIMIHEIRHYFDYLEYLRGKNRFFSLEFQNQKEAEMNEYLANHKEELWQQTWNDPRTKDLAAFLQGIWREHNDADQLQAKVHREIRGFFNQVVSQRVRIFMTPFEAYPVAEEIRYLSYLGNSFDEAIQKVIGWRNITKTPYGDKSPGYPWLEAHLRSLVQ
jgi:hypothetical protein